jgi:hypothetical protein
MASPIVTAEGYERESWASLLRLNPLGASPPTANYVTADDLISVYSSTNYSNVAMALVYRLLLPDGKVSVNYFNFFVGNTSSTNLNQFPLTEGFLLSVLVYGFFNSGLRAIFCQVQLNRTRQTPPISTSVLCSGYPSASVPISFPFGVNTNNWDATGNIRAVTGTAPSVGNNINEVVPATSRWRINSCRFVFTTSAAVGNRDVYLYLVSSGLPLVNILMNTSSQTAGLTWDYTAGSNMAQVTAVSQRYCSNSIPPTVILSGGDSIQTSVVGMQAGDQLSYPFYQFEEWLCP